MDFEQERLLFRLEWAVILTLFALAVVGLAGMAGMDEVAVFLIRVLTLDGLLG